MPGQEPGLSAEEDLWQPAVAILTDGWPMWWIRSAAERISFFFPGYRTGQGSCPLWSGRPVSARGKRQD